MTYKSIPSSNIVDMSPSAIRSPKTFVMGGSLKTLTQLIKSLFSNNEVGFAYDPNDLTTLYQDAAGTIPVTATGQPVGLMKDKSGRNNHASQTVSASRPILQRNATTGAYYLAFDGADDFLKTNNIDFTATGKVSLFAGVRKLSDSTQSVITELGITQISSFIIHCGGGGGTEAYTFGSRGSGLYSYAILGKASNPSLLAPHSAVLTAKAEISTTAFIKANDKSSINNSNQGTGNYGNYPLYIGRRGGTSLPFSGHLYSLIGIGRLTTDSETIPLEKSIAKNTGVTLNA